MDFVEEHSQTIIEMILVYGPKLLLALLVLVVGFWVIKRVVKLLDRALAKREVDTTLRGYPR